MDKICNGSGEPAYYRYKGRKILLCETVGVRHIHCECGEPVIGGSVGDRCKDCNRRSAGLALHLQETKREDRNHINVTERSGGRRVSLDLNPLS